MRNPLLIAVLAALLGFGGWVWLTGPGTSVPNALLALLCATVCGRAAWALAARDLPEEDAPALPAAAEARRASPPPAGRRAPPPADPAPWRRPVGAPEGRPEAPSDRAP
ncbi:hypothetical protein [Muricoccus vinaceus]|uniref:Uncharacterized protein n=1 Tax=Muricoccus vinaceus TaxID=424704 RepID=A0ABV6IKQ4_9PROT